MSTHCTLTIKLSNRNYKGIYCHFDGDIALETLNKFWTKEEDVQKLIDAIQYTGNNVSEIENFVGTNLLHYNTQEENDYQLGIPTLEGIMKASIGDYIIRGAKGEFYPCKPDIFKITYDEVQC